jgi:hypothetical protein
MKETLRKDIGVIDNTVQQLIVLPFIDTAFSIDNNETF